MQYTVIYYLMTPRRAAKGVVSVSEKFAKPREFDSDLSR
jgi:hypothetical protein